MCGIFAAFSREKIISFNKSNIQEQVNKIMGHRGPDNSGIYLSQDRKVLLIHTRLSIQDLTSKGNQPFLSPDNSRIIYNGEIYNSKEISAQLSIDNPRSDTDLLAKLLIRNPIDNIGKIEGMYAFVKYSSKEQNIIFGRDYFGEKPLYIYKNNGFTFLFSEINFLKLAKYFTAIELNLDENSLTRFLLYGYRQVYSQDKGISFFSDLKAVAPGTINEYNLLNGEIEVKTINGIARDFIDSKEDNNYSFNDLKKSIISNISDRSISDVPTGVSLSGGIDSNLITSILCKTNNPPQLAFTINSKDKRYSEVETAKYAANQYGIEHISIDINHFELSPVENFIKLSSQRKSPFLTLTSFVSWYIANSANKHGIKVMFSGLGGDELFSGYYDHYYFRQNSQFISEQEILNFKNKILPMITNPILSDEDSALGRVNNFAHHYEDLKERILMLNYQKNIECPKINMMPSKSSLRSRMFAEITNEVIPIILHEDDINYMNCSVENRSPMLSRRIFLDSLKIPESKLFSDGFQKNPLRQISKELIPEKIRSTYRKIGFNYSIWDFVDSDKKSIYDLLNNETILWNLINKDFFMESFNSRNISEKFLFCIISAQAFLVTNKNEFLFG